MFNTNRVRTHHGVDLTHTAGSVRILSAPNDPNTHYAAEITDGEIPTGSVAHTPQGSFTFDGSQFVPLGASGASVSGNTVVYQSATVRGLTPGAPMGKREITGNNGLWGANFDAYHAGKSMVSLYIFDEQGIGAATIIDPARYASRADMETAIQTEMVANPSLNSVRVLAWEEMEAAVPIPCSYSSGALNRLVDHRTKSGKVCTRTSWPSVNAFLADVWASLYAGVGPSVAYPGEPRLFWATGNARTRFRSWGLNTVVEATRDAELAAVAPGAGASHALRRRKAYVVGTGVVDSSTPIAMDIGGGPDALYKVFPLAGTSIWAVYPDGSYSQIARNEVYTAIIEGASLLRAIPMKADVDPAGGAASVPHYAIRFHPFTADTTTVTSVVDAALYDLEAVGTTPGKGTEHLGIWPIPPISAHATGPINLKPSNRLPNVRGTGTNLEMEIQYIIRDKTTKKVTLLGDVLQMRKGEGLNFLVLLPKVR